MQPKINKIKSLKKKFPTIVSQFSYLLAYFMCIWISKMVLQSFKYTFEFFSYVQILIINNESNLSSLPLLCLAMYHLSAI